ncbi:MAG: hypothetical protein K2K02_10710 [Ruminococcus sp.]|nr:hypothetical protein [Ruminococcus sp.]MDE6679496.1 hypothetical protein [Ruminococcus sp.]
MAVDLIRFNGDWNNKKSEIIFSYPISSENFFRNIWTVAITESKLKLFKDWGNFTPNQINEVLDELCILIKWCDDNLTGNDHFRMYSRIEELMIVIPKEAPNSNEPFYIF